MRGHTMTCENCLNVCHSQSEEHLYSVLSYVKNSLINAPLESGTYNSAVFIWSLNWVWIEKLSTLDDAQHPLLREHGVDQAWHLWEKYENRSYNWQQDCIWIKGCIFRNVKLCKLELGGRLEGNLWRLWGLWWMIKHKLFPGSQRIFPLWRWSSVRRLSGMRWHITLVKQLVLFLCLTSAGLCKIYTENLHETWCRAGTRAEEQPTTFWGRSYDNCRSDYFPEHCLFIEKTAREFTWDTSWWNPAAPVQVKTVLIEVNGWLLIEWLVRWWVSRKGRGCCKSKNTFLEIIS